MQTKTHRVSTILSATLWLVLAGLIIGSTVQSTGLAARAAHWIIHRFGGSYPRIVTGCVLIGAALIFFLPSAIGRVMILIPIVATLADRMGFLHNSKGRAGLILATALGTLLPSYAVLPSTIPNLAMVGSAEKLYGITFSYGEYFWINFPVLAVLVIAGLPVMITRLLPARSDFKPVDMEGTWSREEISLLIILIVALALWMTDFAHGISPAWIALAVAAACHIPGLGPGRETPLLQGVNFGLWFFIAALIGLGGIISHSGLGQAVGQELVAFAELSSGGKFHNYAAVTLIGSVMTALTTTLGAPSVMTPLAETLAQATGWPIETILMLQVPSWMFIPMPYQLPALVPVIALGGICMRHCTRILLAQTLFGFVVAIPLQFVWLSILGYLD